MILFTSHNLTIVLYLNLMYYAHNLLDSLVFVTDCIISSIVLYLFYIYFSRLAGGVIFHWS